MPSTSRNLTVDAQGLPAPQYFNPDTDIFEPLVGNDGSQMVNSVRRRWRDEFSGVAIDAAKWVVVQTGTGQTVGVGTVASSLTIDSGVTANAETILRTAITFTVPFRVQFDALISQRIANQEFYLEIIDTTDGTCFARWLFSGTTATTGTVSNGAHGTNVADANVTIATSATRSIFELDVFLDEIFFGQRTLNSATVRSTLAVRQEKVLPPDRQYHVRIRVKNLSTAPASTTRLTVDAVGVQDIAELTAEITGGRGSSSANQAIPVAYAAGTFPVSGTVSIQQALARSTYGQLSVTNLAASASYTGTGRDINNAARYRVTVAHTAGNTPGILIFQESTDNTTFREVRRIPIPSDGLYRNFQHAPTLRYVRVVFTNGATAQTFFYIADYPPNVDGLEYSDYVLHFLETTTALAASATYNGNTLDLGGMHDWDRFRAFVFADVAGTLNHQQSRDGTTWRTTTTQAVAANTPVVIDQPIAVRYQRVQYVNGATIQATFELVSTLVSR